MRGRGVGEGRGVGVSGGPGWVQGWGKGGVGWGWTGRAQRRWEQDAFGRGKRQCGKRSLGQRRHRPKAAVENLVCERNSKEAGVRGSKGEGEEEACEEYQRGPGCAGLSEKRADTVRGGAVGRRKQSNGYRCPPGTQRATAVCPAPDTPHMRRGQILERFSR